MSAETNQSSSNAVDVKTILIVDDEPVVLNFITTFLQNVGYRTEDASDGDKALEIFREHAGQFDLVLTDLTLPGLSGIDLIRAMHRINPGLKAMAITGMDDELLHEALELPGVRGVLQKPFRGDQLLKAIQKIF